MKNELMERERIHQSMVKKEQEFHAQMERIRTAEAFRVSECSSSLFTSFFPMFALFSKERSTNLVCYEMLRNWNKLLLCPHLMVQHGNLLSDIYHLEEEYTCREREEEVRRGE